MCICIFEHYTKYKYLPKIYGLWKYGLSLQTDKVGKAIKLKKILKGNMYILSKYSTLPHTKKPQKIRANPKEKIVYTWLHVMSLVLYHRITQPQFRVKSFTKRSEAYDEDYEEITVRIQQKISAKVRLLGRSLGGSPYIYASFKLNQKYLDLSSYCCDMTCYN